MDTNVLTNPAPPLLTYRGFYGSRDHLPFREALTAIRACVPFWFTIYDSQTSLGGGIAAQDTDRGQVTVQEDCWLVSLIASSQQVAGFSAELYDSERQISFSDGPIINVNGFGTALRQFLLKKPQEIKLGGQLEARVINLATVSNIVQIIGFGLRPDSRKR
jgi:hypothetical protein